MITIVSVSKNAWKCSVEYTILMLEDQRTLSMFPVCIFRYREHSESFHRSGGEGRKWVDKMGEGNKMYEFLRIILGIQHTTCD